MADTIPFAAGHHNQVVDWAVGVCPWVCKHGSTRSSPWRLLGTPDGRRPRPVPPEMQ